MQQVVHGVKQSHIHKENMAQVIKDAKNH